MHNIEIEAQDTFDFVLLDGSIFRLCLSDLQVILVVNTASQCGFARQYMALQELHERYQPQGFSVLGVSSDNFGKQEFSTACAIESAIKDKCPSITFPITQLTAVSGKEIHPFYAWAAAQLSYLGKPKWNFHKYLVGKRNAPLLWFSSFTDPLSTKMIKAIESALCA